MKIQVQWALVVFMISLCSPALAAAANPDSVIGREGLVEPAPIVRDTREHGHHEGLSGVLLGPGAAFRAVGLSDPGSRTHTNPVPVPAPAPASGSASWIFAGAILAAFISFTVIVVSASANE